MKRNCLIRLDNFRYDLPYTGLEHIESWTGKRIALNGEAASEGQANLYKRGDVLFGKLRPYLAKAHAAGTDGICTGELLVLRPRTVHQTFLLDYLLNQDFIAIVDSSTYGAKMPRANWDFIGSLPMLVPPDTEQHAIAAFLDRETARIDGLIAKKQRQIELLQEKRMALISHAVTKGLDPNVKRRDSGIDWLGQIPEHWDTVPLRWYLRISSGSFMSNTDFVTEAADDKTVPVVGGNGVMGFTDRANVHYPTLIVGRVGVYCGNVHLIPGPAWITDNALMLWQVRGFRLPYLRHILTTANLNRLANQSTQPLVTGTMVKEQTLPLPPAEEQELIVTVITSRSEELDSLMAKVQTSMDLLREYRTALISAAVTGKIDVREDK